MARIKTSAIISDITGKLNGSVFQRNQGGLSVRNQSGRINSNTARSNFRKVGISIVQTAWQQLSTSDRVLWSTYATYLNKKQKKNPTLAINGHQLFININSLRLDLSTANPIFSPPLLTTPILQPPPPPALITNLAINFGDITVTLDTNIDNTKMVVILFLSRPLTASQQSPNQKMLLMKSATDNGFDFICTNYYTEVYGRSLQVGEYVQTKLAIYNTDNENYSAFSVARWQVQ